jgi:DNA-binding winged helix-turn-helix (wHTH) protein/TolB-like protein
MTAQNSSAFLFDDVRIESATFRAFKAENAIQLEPKAFRLLLFLIENRERLIEKEELLDAIWQGTHVTENALAREIAKLRKSLNDDPKVPKYIQTVHTRGYRFIAEVHLAGDNGRKSFDPVPPSEAGKTESVALDLAKAKGGSRLKSAPRPRVGGRVVVLAGFVVLLLIGGLIVWRRAMHTASGVSANATVSVAILPFKTSGGAADEFLGIEIADALVAKLGNSTKLAVSPVTSALHYAQTTSDPRTSGQLMKVDYVLDGEIDRAHQHLATRLIRVRDGATLLSESYDEKFNDIFQLEDSVCAKVISNLLVTLNHEDVQRARRRYTENPRAYEAFLKGHYFMNQATRPGIDAGIENFQQAIELDPNYAMAYAGLSDCYMRLGRFGVAPAEFLPKSRAAVMKALELDETVAYAHSMLGRIAFQHDWDFARAGSEYARARQLQPGLIHAWYASYLLALNHVSEAEVEFEAFEGFLPFLPGNTSLPQFLYFTGRYDRAVDLLQRKIAANSDGAHLHESLGLVYEQQRRVPEAIEEFQKAIELSHNVCGLGALGHIYATSGRSADAENTLKSIDKLSKQIYISPYQKAVIYAGLGEKDQALRFLEQAYAERSLLPTLLRFDPRLGELRKDPRFQDFMRRTGLPL